MNAPATTERSSPLATIVIPTYNRWPTVSEAVDSALHQQASDVEVIVVDDGSTDNTSERLAERYPSLTVIRQENAERGTARNRGAKAAHGTYLTFLDSDDVLEPWHVSELAALVAQCRARGLAGPAVASAPVLMWTPTTGSMAPLGLPVRLHRRLPLKDASLLGTVLPLPGLFVDAGAFAAVGGFPTDRRIATNEDWVLLARLAQVYPVARMTRASVRVRDHPGRSMANAEQACCARRAAAELVLAEGLGTQPLTERQRRLVRAGMHHFCAANWYGAGEMALARSHLRQALTEIGWRRGVALGGRLWAQTLLGRRGSALASRTRDRSLSRHTPDDEA